MPVYFRTLPVKEPFIFESLGSGWDQEPVQRPEGYPFYHYLQTEKGKGRIEIQGRSYCLDEGKGVLIAPSVKHAYRREGDEWRTLFVTITGTMESSIGTIIGNRQVVFIEENQGERIKEQITQALEMQSREPLNTKRLSGACYEFLLNFTNGIYSAEMSDNALYQQYVKPVLKEIETNYYERLVVSELSRKVYVTQQYLSRLFHRFLGCSVYEYITSYRISKAKELLVNPRQLEIQFIAHQVGFEDSSHFIMMFRKMTGMTPVEFRGLHQNDR